MLSGPTPVLEQPELAANFLSWTFTVEPLGALSWMPFHLLPSAAEGDTSTVSAPSFTLPLIPDDPLATEQFCLLLTTDFSLIMVLGESLARQPIFQFSFEPEVIQTVWHSLRSRISMTSPHQLQALDELVNQFAPIAPGYQIVLQFSQLLLSHLPEPSPSKPQGELIQVDDNSDHIANSQVSQNQRPTPVASKNEPSLQSTPTYRWPQGTAADLPNSPLGVDAELLQAMAHEIRTPLTTIRTLTRSLLKRRDLKAEVMKRLRMIDQECTQQIDRFSLIFRAVELETQQSQRSLSLLSAIALEQVFQDSIPRWQKQSSQRGFTLEVILPQKLPMVISDPIMLDQVLTGLIERFTHSLPARSHIQLRVSLAGHQLKLQFQSKSQLHAADTDQALTSADSGATEHRPTLKSIGQMLMFQPETGGLSLNLAVTKNLFQALGGKLIVRQKPQRGEILTIFLPLETKRPES
ncbi:MAG: HAMP domain-containing histidine kinase [Cyanothece sp. SIO1E1]|nr:HAMP domain-containing histidine kinase [Cyanothece sp. SIO1E1]